MITREGIIFLLCAALLACGCVSVSLAQGQPKTMGDWLVSANALNPNKYSDDGESVHAAVTDALNGRDGRMGIWGCGRFSVAFNLETDVQFDGKKPEEMGQDPTRVVYSKVLPFESKLSPMILERGDVEHFLFDADSLARGGKFLICPTQEEGPRCLTFSLRGITAALNAACPKR